MFELPDLPYEYNALEPHIDEQTMRIHHDKHHATYVEKLNSALEGNDELLGMDIVDLLMNLDKVPEGARTAVRNNGGGHANHSLFWTVMSPDGGGEPEGALADEISSNFGSFDKFKTELANAGAGQFGSGWAWLTLEGEKLHVCSTPNQDSPYMKGNIPLLGIDVWEHAYYLKYQNRRPDYISAWWNVVDWDAVSKRFEEAKS